MLGPTATTAFRTASAVPDEPACRTRCGVRRGLPGCLVAVAAAVGGCGPAPQGAASADGGAPDLTGGHAEYLQGLKGARLELVEPGTDGAWREIRGGGRVVRLAAPPRRIASRTLATDEILLAIAEPERIVLLSPFAGDPRLSAAADAANRLGRIGGFSTEEILAASPDVVFAAGFNSQESLAQLEDAGLPVVVLLDHESLEAIERNIRTVGFAIGRDARAERLAASMRARLEAARARAGSRVRGLRVVHWSGGVVLGSRTVFDDAVRYLGAVNAAAEDGLQGWPRVGAEQLVIWDPDVIFTGADEAGDAAGVLDSTRAGRVGNIEPLGGPDMAAISHHAAGLVERLADALLRAAERIGAADARIPATAAK